MKKGRQTMTKGRQTVEEGRQTVTKGRQTVEEGRQTMTKGRQTVILGHPSMKVWRPSSKVWHSSIILGRSFFTVWGANGRDFDENGSKRAVFWQLEDFRVKNDPESQNPAAATPLKGKSASLIAQVRARPVGDGRNVGVRSKAFMGRPAFELIFGGNAAGGLVFNAGSEAPMKTKLFAVLVLLAVLAIVAGICVHRAHKPTGSHKQVHYEARTGRYYYVVREKPAANDDGVYYYWLMNGNGGVASDYYSTPTFTRLTPGTLAKESWVRGNPPPEGEVNNLSEPTEVVEVEPAQTQENLGIPDENSLDSMEGVPESGSADAMSSGESADSGGSSGGGDSGGGDSGGGGDGGGGGGDGGGGD
jgi:uncharacterized membrane protein YgcG